MTHFLYAYTDDGQDGLELRYSLRSLEQHFLPDDGGIEITIAGDSLPDWIRGVEHVEVQGEHPPGGGLRLWNVVRNVAISSQALLDAGVAEVIYMNDDFMLLDPASEVLPLHRGDWGAFYAKRNRFTEKDFEWFTRGMNVTHRYVGKLENPKCYELHRPLPLSTQRAASLLHRFLDLDPGEAPLWRSLYGNLAGFSRPAVEARDVRVSSAWPVGSAWISTDQRYWNRAEKRVTEMFTTPSRWER